MRYLFAFAVVLFAAHGAFAQEKESLEYTDAFNIVCADMVSAQAGYAMHREALQREENLEGNSLRLLRAIPSKCWPNRNVGWPALPIDYTDTVINGRVLRTYFFSAYDSFSQKMIYVVKDVLLKERVSSLPRSGGVSFYVS